MLSAINVLEFGDTWLLRAIVTFLARNITVNLLKLWLHKAEIEIGEIR
jgi:hypothetical protein